MKEISEKFIHVETDENGTPIDIKFKNTERFNFAYDIVDELGEKTRDKRAMLYVDKDKNEKDFSFGDMSRYSSKTANYFRNLGIKKGDRVMLVLKRHYQFWFAILALHKIGAIVIPSTHQLKKGDFEYRFATGDITAIVCTDQDGTAAEAEKAIVSGNYDILKIMTGKAVKGWHSFDNEMERYPDSFERTETLGDDPMLMFFTSGTTGYPKIVTHNFKYPLGHYLTAKYWQKVDTDGLHFSVADTGWGKALWGKLYGQWLCEAAVFVYDMESFVPHDFLSLFSRYGITTFCAPPTAYRIFVKRIFPDTA